MKPLFLLATVVIITVRCFETKDEDIAARISTDVHNHKLFIGNSHGEKPVDPLPNSHIGRGSQNPPSYKIFGYDPDQDQPGALLEVNKCMQKACLELKTISGQIKIMRKRMEEDERDEQAENDWKFAAMVVDRLCLFIFTIFIVVSTCGIMFSSPHLIA